MATAVLVAPDPNAVAPAPAAPARQVGELAATAPMPYRGDWYAIVFWFLGAAILLLLHVVDVVRWIL